MSDWAEALDDWALREGELDEYGPRYGRRRRYPRPVKLLPMKLICARCDHEFESDRFRACPKCRGWTETEMVRFARKQYEARGMVCERNVCNSPNLCGGTCKYRTAKP